MTPSYQLLGAACVALFAFPALAAGDVEAGLALYQTRCAACHSLDYNGVGPAHRGVFQCTDVGATRLTQQWPIRLSKWR